MSSTHFSLLNVNVNNPNNQGKINQTESRYIIGKKLTDSASELKKTLTDSDIKILDKIFSNN